MTSSVWERLHERLDLRRLRPQLRADVVVQPQTSARYGPYFMLKSPRAGTYLRLSPAEYQLAKLMDGERTVKDLIVEYFLRHRSLAFDRIIQLVELLHHREFLVDRPVDTFTRVRRQLRAHSLRARAGRALEFLMRSELALSNLDPFVTAVHRAIGWLVFSRSALAILAITALAGFIAFLSEGQITRVDFVQLFGRGLGFILIVPAFFSLLIFSHEMAHALVCKHFGREVRRGGFTLFFGFPAFFVDTTDIWLESRWRRIAVSAAGSLSDTVVAGAFALLSQVLPGDLGVLCLVLAGIAYLDIALNLIPLLELDGYYVLVDLLEMPMLRVRAFRFVRENLLRKLRRRERLTHEERILAIYGVVAGTFSLLFFYRALLYVERQIVRLGTAIVEAGNWLLTPVLILIVVTVGIPLLVRLWRQVSSAATTARRGVRAAATAAEQNRLRGRVMLLCQIPMLAELPPAQLEAIAAGMRPRRYKAGHTIVRQGEQGDRFYLIVRGSAEVLVASAVDSTDRSADPILEQVASLGPGDYFGERALLHRAPRAATVRSTVDLEVLALSADQFARLVSPTWQLRERLQRAADARDAIANLELFKDLRPSERDLLLTRLETESFEAGETIIRQGDIGEQFYLIREGEADVTRQQTDGTEEHVATLGAGDFFGELALLYSAPRTATVRARTQVQLWSLERRDFDELLLRFLRLGERFEVAGRERLAALEQRGAALVS